MSETPVAVVFVVGWFCSVVAAKCIWGREFDADYYALHLMGVWFIISFAILVYYEWHKPVDHGDVVVKT